MSRGCGSIQRAVIEYLKAVPRERGEYPRWTFVQDLAHRIFHPDEDDLAYTPPTRAQVESVRRAVKRLQASGAAETARVTTTVRVTRPVRGRLRTYAGDTETVDADRRLLAVRPTLTDAERAAERAALDAERAALSRSIAAMLRGEALAQVPPA